jgi:nuclear inhibitor of protein phosphatase 1
VSFGASTRAYTLREKPQTLPSAVKGDEKMSGEDDELKGLLGLPEEETELDVIPCLYHFVFWDPGFYSFL